MNSQIKRYIGWGLGGSLAQEHVPVELGCITLPVCGGVHQPGSSETPYFWDFYGGLITVGSITNFISIPSPLSEEVVGVALKIPTFWLWLYLSDDQHQSRSIHPPRVTSLEQKMLLVLLSLRNLQGFQESRLRDWGQRPNIRARDAPSALVT